ncbi:MAG: hypothetical protein H6727_01455 [Myxococcales bacterium]|nr:hypothetical protein [Myxococcales bacterium]
MRILFYGVFGMCLVGTCFFGGTVAWAQEKGACDIVPFLAPKRKKVVPRKVKKSRKGQKERKKRALNRKHRRRISPRKLPAVGTKAYNAEVLRRLIRRPGPRMLVSKMSGPCGPPVWVLKGEAICSEIRRSWQTLLAYKALRRCYERALKSRSIHGSVSFELIVTLFGRVMSIADRGGTMKDKEVRACLYRMLRRKRFPKCGAMLRFFVRLDFRAGK